MLQVELKQYSIMAKDKKDFATLFSIWEAKDFLPTAVLL